MPSLPLLVSLIVARAREQNANATGPEEVVPDDIRIDMDGTDKPHHTQEKHQETAKEDCSIAGTSFFTTSIASLYLSSFR